ncbi:MAG TPA: GNAT family N-acetyltransferase [Candidatus Mediterraneibacter stercoripullorum]|nr:GNAT family N-acetyltransferase [Candidatus Mediterraneibacter stercoripullorum]
MEIRPYKTEDIQEIAELFYQTVHTVNAADYTNKQLDAWTDGNIDLAAWDRSFQAHMTLVAVITQSEAEDKKDASEQIAGFADMNSTGYMDRLYVHKDFQHCGIASALCDRLEEAVDADQITTHASITAKPFFEKRGYRVIREQQVERKGILLTNYVMEKILKA